MPRPPPTFSRRQSKSMKSASSSIVRVYGSSSKMLEPMWAWMPTRLSRLDARTRRTASRARPSSSPKPNFESSCPVCT